MRRSRAIVGTMLFLVAAPGTVVGLVPWWLSHWAFRPPFFGTWFSRAAGAALMPIGAVALIECFARFALSGFGTPAPIFPTRKLVVTGLYRRVRNPMYLAVISVILGQALVFASVPLLVYSACVWLVAHIFVLAYEEPTLRRSFPDDFAAYAAAVPRWRPRLTPWRGETEAK